MRQMTSEDVGWQIASTLATERTLSDDPGVRHRLHRQGPSPHAPRLLWWLQRHAGRSWVGSSDTCDVQQCVEAGCDKAALAREFGVTRQTIYNVLAATMPKTTASQ